MSTSEAPATLSDVVPIIKEGMDVYRTKPRSELYEVKSIDGRMVLLLNHATGYTMWMEMAELRRQLGSERQDDFSLL